MAKTLLELVRMNGMKSPLAALSPYTMPQFSQVAFVDHENGSNAEDGSDWDHAVKDFNHALDLFWGGNETKAQGRHYGIFYQCRTTTGMAHTELQTIDLGGVHIYGMGKFFGLGGGHTSCFVAGPSTGYASKCAIKFTKSGCSIEGIKFYMPSEYGLGAEESFIYATNPIGFAVDSCQFIGANNNGDCTGLYVDGILIEGAESAVITNNQFVYTYRGLKAMAGSSRYFHKAIIEHNKFFSPDKGIYFGDAYGVENEIAFNSIQRKAAAGVGYGYALTGGIDLSGGGSGNHIHDNRVAHGTATTAYVKGAGTNYWEENYVGAGSGGALYTET